MGPSIATFAVFFIYLFFSLFFPRVPRTLEGRMDSSKSCSDEFPLYIDVVKRRIFMYCGASHFRVLRQVCRAWNDPYMCGCVTFVDSIKSLCEKALSLSIGCGSARGMKVRSRVEFLDETLHLLLSWDLPFLPHVSSWRFLCQHLILRLQETVSILVRVSEGTFPVNDTFDVFDLTLRRYHQMLSAFRTSLPRPCDGVDDAAARVAWTERMGPHCGSVSWRQFKSLFALHGKMSQRKKKTVMKVVKFLVNFPDDDCLLPYQLDLLCKWFGPFEEVLNNAQNYAMGRGFLGLINRIQAKVLLTEHQESLPGSCWYLLRLSRTEPSYLVLSCINSNGVVTHSLCQQNISQRIRKLAPSNQFRVVPLRLAEGAFEATSMSGYSTEGGYVMMDDDDDKKAKKKNSEAEVVPPPPADPPAPKDDGSSEESASSRYTFSRSTSYSTFDV